MKYSKEFLKALDEEQYKVLYTRLVSLNWQELPVDCVTGVYTGGSVSLDGSSAARRTCSLSLVTTDNFKKDLWVRKTKFKVFIGLQNTLKYNTNFQEYAAEDIIWFDKGLFVITSFSSTLSASGVRTINIQGKDKIALLNGELGGTFGAQIKFDSVNKINKVYQYIDTNTILSNYYPITHYYTKNKSGKYEPATDFDLNTKYYELIDLSINQKTPLKTIISTLLQAYGNESQHNIIINDLDEYGQELLQYAGQKAAYAFKKVTDGSDFVNITFNGDMIVQNMKSGADVKLDEILDSDLYRKDISGTVQGTQFKTKDDNISWYIIRLSYGVTSGYRLIELQYPGDLIANAGETVTSILDKITNTFGTFEYFYDEQGRFVFQKKVIYNNLYNPFSNNSSVSLAQYTPYSYVFKNENLLTQISNNPNITSIKNDYVIWGNSENFVCHLRVAIDKRPQIYKNFEEQIFYTNEWPNVQPDGGILADWRELIYQMAKDHADHSGEADFTIILINNNAGYNIIKDGKTGYEYLYPDMLSFWRQLYCPKDELENYSTFVIDETGEASFVYSSRQGGYIDVDKQAGGGYNTGKTFWYQPISIYPSNFLGQTFYVKTPTNTYELVNSYSDEVQYYEQLAPTRYKKEHNYKASTENPNYYWTKDKDDNVEGLHFWLEFIEADTESMTYSVNNIGNRTYVSNSKVDAIQHQEIPNFIYYTPSESAQEFKEGYERIQLSENDMNNFITSTRQQSAFDIIDSHIKANFFDVQNINITTLPVFYLEPNTMIRIEDKEKLGIQDDFIIKSINYSFNSNTMSISLQPIVQGM